MKNYHKEDYPVDNVRRFLEPGPVVLVSSSWKGESDIMTMGWHMMMEFTPSLGEFMVSGRTISRKSLMKPGMR